MRILITGGSSGLGAAMVRRFRAQGHQVLVADLAEPAAAPGVEYQRLDVRSDADWQRVREWCEREWGGLDVLVNNAGVSAAGRVEKVDQGDWDWILDINLLGVIRGCRAFVPLLKRQGSGHIVNVASMAGLMNLPGMASYNVTKAGVISLSETMRHELAPYGVRTSVVCPSFVRTNLGASLRSPDIVLARAADRLISNAKVTAEDVAEQVADAVARNRFLVITHREARLTLLLKRFLPAVVDAQIRKFWVKTKVQLDLQDARAAAEQPAK